jgi:glycine cleavage system H protein
MVPDELLYTKDHEWIRVEGQEAVIGITNHAQNELGEIVFLDLPEPGRTVRAGEEFGTVESVKAVSEIYSPVSGEVTAVNRVLMENPDNSATVNKDPYGEGWLVRLRFSDPAEVKKLLDRASYEGYLTEAAD